MNREDVIRVAREAGLLNCDCCLPFWDEDDQENWKRFFVNFAALVAAAEREACARVAGIAMLGADRMLAVRVQTAIRTREQA